LSIIDSKYYSVKLAITFCLLFHRFHCCQLRRILLTKCSDKTLKTTHSPLLNPNGGGLGSDVTRILPIFRVGVHFHGIGDLHGSTVEPGVVFGTVVLEPAN